MERDCETSRTPDHTVRRILLPSGRSVEVVTLGDQPPATRERSPWTVDLHICPACDARLVYPVEWAPVSDTEWEVELRCPNCDLVHVGTFEQDEVDRFDEELDRGTSALVRDLKRMERANMEDEVESFVRALRADAIWPIDF